MPKVVEFVPFRLIQTPCCGTLLCHVNHRLPSYYPECGTRIFEKIKESILFSDMDAELRYNA